MNTNQSTQHDATFQLNWIRMGKLLLFILLGNLLLDWLVSMAASAQETPATPVASVTSHTKPAKQEDCYLVPTPTLTPTMSLPEMPVLNPPVWKDEVLVDGGDRRLGVRVDRDWDVHGLDVEDTIAHFDTLNGQRLVQPSNRVGIYSPRFRAVRKITNLVDTRSKQSMASVDETTEITQSRSSDFSSTTLQNLQPVRNRVATTPSGFRDETRGVYVDNTTVANEYENQFKPFEDFNTIKFGKLDGREKARLASSLQSAKSWTGDLEVLSNVHNLRLIEAKDVETIEQTVGVRNKLAKPAIRLIKVASKMAAEVEEEVEFTLRFDNIGNQLIGNVTIIDNLTGRLEYIEGSGQCSIEANLITELNEAGSTRLRWEIINPLEVGEGGIIRFRCRVR